MRGASLELNPLRLQISWVHKAPCGEVEHSEQHLLTPVMKVHAQSQRVLERGNPEQAQKMAERLAERLEAVRAAQKGVLDCSWCV